MSKDEFLRSEDRKTGAPATSKARGYAYAGKVRSAYLPGALPNTWAEGDPAPTDAQRYDMPDRPTLDDDGGALSPAELMAEPEPTDPTPGKFRGPPWPDRKRDPYAWESFFRDMMRASPWSMRQTPWTLARAMVGTSSVCRWCETVFAQADTGRPREYCSDDHRVAAYRDRRRREAAVTKRG